MGAHARQTSVRMSSPILARAGAGGERARTPGHCAASVRASMTPASPSSCSCSERRMASSSATRRFPVSARASGGEEQIRIREPRYPSPAAERSARGRGELDLHRSWLEPHAGGARTSIRIRSSARSARCSRPARCGRSARRRAAHPDSCRRDLGHRQIAVIAGEEDRHGPAGATVEGFDERREPRSTSPI